MSDLQDTLRKIFLASVGAAATTGEKVMELADQFAQRGEKEIERGRELNGELTQKISETAKDTLSDFLYDRIAGMKPEDRSALLDRLEHLRSEPVVTTIPKDDDVS